MRLIHEYHEIDFRIPPPPHPKFEGLVWLHWDFDQPNRDFKVARRKIQ